MVLPWKTAWVTGASSGIGRELAIRLAIGGVRVAVTARSADKLIELTNQSSNISAFPADVADPSAMMSAHGRIAEALGDIDLAILNAGVWDPANAAELSAARAAATMSVNFSGLTNALEPLIPGMIARRSGHIALVSSVAGYRGLPKAIYYGPSKAAAISLAEVLQCELAPRGVKISIVNPGFVETPMTAVNEFPMPFLMQVDDAAKHILRGLERGQFEIAFPWQTVAMMKLMRMLPYSAYFWLVRNVIARESVNEGNEKPPR